jgi:non-ribosomal peptide synthetase component E (peptide arylation enzyme)
MITRGWIQRVAASEEVIKQLQTENPRDRVAIYAENGYWSDTLKTLVDLRAANPNDSSLWSDWSDLFKSVGLEAIAKQPISTLEPEPTEKP